MPYIYACKVGCDIEKNRGRGRGEGGGQGRAGERSGGKLTDSDGYGEETEACEDIFNEEGLAGSDEGGAHPVVFVVVGVVGSVGRGLDEKRVWDGGFGEQVGGYLFNMMGICLLHSGSRDVHLVDKVRSGVPGSARVYFNYYYSSGSGGLVKLIRSRVLHFSFVHLLRCCSVHTHLRRSSPERGT